MGERLVVWHRAVARAGGVAANDPSPVASWSKAVAARFSAAGGAVLVHLSGTVVACFDLAEIGDVIDLVLDLLDEADAGPFAVSFGAAVSALSDSLGVLSGSAIESAEALAVRAHAGEVVLDPVARDRARGLFLFSRHVGAGSAANKAASVDRTHPRRDACAAAMARLGPVPLAPATEALLPSFEAALSTEGGLVVLRGPVGAGTVELLRAASSHLAPSHVIEIGGASAGVVPLGSLRAALARERAFRELSPRISAAARDALSALVSGALVPADALRAAAIELVDSAGGRVWFFLTPVALVDAATLALLVALQRARPSVVLVGRHAVDAALPAAVADLERVELTLPSLRTSDARVIAQAALGPATAADVARRVAVLGGDTPLGVVEAARAMIGAGDLVLEEDRFVWRSTPRGGVRALALDVLVAERLELLDDESRRVLEAVVVIRDGAPRALTERLAARDGVRPRAITRGLERLGREGWLDPRHVEDVPRPISSFVRRFVLSAVPPARAAELHRFAAEALEEADATLADRIERAVHQVEGGRDDLALAALVEGARTARELGHAAGAAQLAMYLARATAADGQSAEVSSLVRELADESARPRPLHAHTLAPPRLEPSAVEADAEEGPVESSVPPAMEPELADAVEALPDDDDVVGAVRDAIRRRDFEGLEHLAERAIAEGSDMRAVARLRALAEALRGDLAGAQRRLERAHAHSSPRDRRALLAEAMVALRGGRLGSATRLALSALADARRAQDERGEAVALFTLAAALRAHGRHADAAVLEARVEP